VFVVAAAELTWLRLAERSGRPRPATFGQAHIRGSPKTLVRRTSVVRSRADAERLFRRLQMLCGGPPARPLWLGACLADRAKINEGGPAD
jgi:hypothetical protein